MQPAYIPWLGYFDRIVKSDIFVILDHVKMDRNSQTKFCNRNKIRTPVGWSWLTIPINTKGDETERPINEIRLTEDTNWKRKHFQALKSNYSRSEYFKDHYDFFEDVYRQDWQMLLPFITSINEYLFNLLKIKTKIIFSSSLNLNHSKSELILEICKITKATKYISGPFGRDYLNKNSFSENNIDLEFHDYQHPVYTQAFDGFESHLSIIDLIFNHGNKSLEILNT